MGFSVLFIGTGFLLGFIYIMNINKEENHRKEMVTLNNNYANLKVVQVKSCQIELEHLGNQISATAVLSVKNTDKEAINEFVLTLNPGLDVIKLTGAGFTRELQLIKVKPDRAMQPGDSLQISINTKGPSMNLSVTSIRPLCNSRIGKTIREV